ncbi:MAG: hypothetical protein OXG82_17110 [Gammaproteobacteria bacterium]|nr:hypothetical protein [Gammaproteobacteria bacterium]
MIAFAPATRTCRFKLLIVDGQEASQFLQALNGCASVWVGEFG